MDSEAGHGEACRLAGPRSRAVGEADAVERLNRRLLASGSATRTLKAWCADHRIGDGPFLAERHACRPERPDDALLDALALACVEVLRHRRVTLLRGALPLADCDLWWVPARLDPAMALALETTAAPFGAVTAPLRTNRRTVFLTRLPAGGQHVLEYQAVLIPGCGDGRVIAAVREQYRRTLLTARAAATLPGGAAR